MVGEARESAIRVVGLSKRYGAHAAVDDLSFEVRAGAVTGFLGPNGAGKTTTLRILLGLARPTAGEAMIFDQPFAAIADPVRTVGAALEISGFHLAMMMPRGYGTIALMWCTVVTLGFL